MRTRATRRTVGMLAGRWRLVAALFLTLISLLSSPIGPASAASHDLDIRVEAGEAVVVASTANRRAELRRPGAAPIRFDQANISVTRGRIVITGRTREHTLTIQATRGTVAGRIGLLERGPGYDFEGRKTRIRPTATSWLVDTVTVGGESVRKASIRRR